VYIILGGIVICAVILFLLYGGKEVNDAVSNMRDANDIIYDIVVAALRATKSITKTMATAAGIEDEFGEPLESGSWCPQLPALSQTVGVDLPPVMSQVTSALAIVGNSAHRETVEELEDQLENIKEASEDFDRLVTPNNFAFVAVFWVMIAFAILTIVLICGVMAAGCNILPDGLRCFLQRVLQPLFTLCSTIFMFFVVLTCVLAIITADFCSGGAKPGSPTGTIYEILESQGMTQETTAYKVTLYYIENCNQDPYGFLEDLNAEVTSAVSNANLFEETFNKFNATSVVAPSLPTFGNNLRRRLQIVNNDILLERQTQHRLLSRFELDPQINTLCDGENATKALEALYDYTNNTLPELADSTVNLINQTSCSNIFKIYDNVMNEAICQNYSTANTWAFFALLIVCLFSKIMSLLFPFDEAYDDPKRDDYYNNGGNNQNEEYVDDIDQSNVASYNPSVQSSGPGGGYVDSYVPAGGAANRYVEPVPPPSSGNDNYNSAPYNPDPPDDEDSYGDAGDDDDDDDDNDDEEPEMTFAQYMKERETAIAEENEMSHNEDKMEIKRFGQVSQVEAEPAVQLM